MTEQAISPLRRRMIEDMSIRKFAAKTQHDYVQRVKDFATFLGRSPGTAEAEDVRRFRLHLTAIGAGTPKINATVEGRAEPGTHSAGPTEIPGPFIGHRFSGPDNPKLSARLTAPLYRQPG